ncbi:polyhydroxyalkanoate depolymerase [Thalassomonas actiniarum]|uniref:Polyhydroxyalkanoate depolymerase n=1 Tax=Thalassomonas actiniarum TaxID=485447 RepID=A0AAF0C1I8_9GAMM|nr:polyhydroxyalkanoate depolymerase [Thalassomonas actiniarum]WDD97477.1 polyhydroxyalkanoate depolymerase [Thalassomonas actiniarum]
MLYQLHQAYTQTVAPINAYMQHMRNFCTQPWSPLSYTMTGKTIAAAAEVVERITENYHKPEFGIKYASIGGNKIAVTEEIVVEKPFCKLRHFKRNATFDQPKLLVVAPLSGHHATLLRGTVEHLISDHEVYITDWENVRDVPVSHGGFSLDDYISYLIDFCEFLSDVHIVAICQATVPTIVAATVMAERKVDFQPKSMTLLGGPIDTRISPTDVNDYAISKELQWFEENVICTVPETYTGVGQKVYPGFIQLTGFLSMNYNSHVHKHFTFFGDLIKGDGDSAENHRKFYNEYLAVMDMPADYYLDTIRRVFIEHQLPQGKMEYQGKVIDCSKVDQVALLTIEGENDDITGVGQTEAAHRILTGIPEDMKFHYVQEDVGHYGVFNGRRFRQEIGPLIRRFITTYNQPRDKAQEQSMEQAL